MPHQRHHASFGPGMKSLGNREEWYGAGYCGICGDTSEALVAEAVRYWCPDDGWKVGVLCVACGADAASHGPKPDDYAYQPNDRCAENIDAVADVLGDDLDCLIGTGADDYLC